MPEAGGRRASEQDGSVPPNALLATLLPVGRQTAPYAWGGIPVIRQGPCDGPEKPCHKPTFGYLSDLGECLGDYALTEIRRFQMADKPPSTDNSTPFTKLESSEARNSATVAISSG